MFHIVYKQQLLKNNDLTNGFMACLHDLVLQTQQLCDMFCAVFNIPKLLRIKAVDTFPCFSLQ